MNYKCWLNGEFVLLDDKDIEQYAPGKLPAQGFFETIHCIKKTIPFLDQHLDRFKKSLQLYIVQPEFTIDEIKTALLAVVHNRNYAHARVRLICWTQDRRVNWMVTLKPFKLPMAATYKSGIRVMTVPFKAPHKPSFVKTLDYDLYLDAYRKAKREGCEEAVLIDDQKSIIEGARSNLFFIKDDKIMTPSLRTGGLNGIVRQWLIQQSGKRRSTISEEVITINKAMHCESAFLTNALVGLVPIAQLNDHVFLPAHPAFIRLADKYNQYIS